MTTAGQLRWFKRCNRFDGRIALNWLTVVSVHIFWKNCPVLTILSAGELVDNRESVYHVPMEPYLHTYYFPPLAMLILCVYGLWERSKRIGAGIAVLVVSLVTAAIILRERRPVSNLIDIVMCGTLILTLNRTESPRLVCQLYLN